MQAIFGVDFLQVDRAHHYLHLGYFKAFWNFKMPYMIYFLKNRAMYSLGYKNPHYIDCLLYTFDFTSHYLLRRDLHQKDK
jgi:hypothetical protein